jgi:hypothetical protein
VIVSLVDDDTGDSHGVAAEIETKRKCQARVKNP